MYIAYSTNDNSMSRSLIGQSLANERAVFQFVICAICYVHLRINFTSKKMEIAMRE